MHVPQPSEAITFLAFMHSCRLLFENVLANKSFSSYRSNELALFNIEALNEFINNTREKVIKIFDALLNVKVPQNDETRQTILSEQSPL